MFTRFPQNLRRPRRLVRTGLAFSLVEVVLAIGLTMFAVLVIVSLFPAGLASLQASNRQLIEAEIFNKVGAELAASPFGMLTNYQATRFPLYLDNEGAEVAIGQSPVFTVRCLAAVYEPGGELARVTVGIGYHSDPAQSSMGGSVTKRTFLVANRGN